MIVNIYLVVTTAIFAYTLLYQFETANNYFAAMLSYSSNPLNIFILYNMIVTLSIAIYKTFVLIFFEAANEGETMVPHFLYRKSSINSNLKYSMSSYSATSLSCSLIFKYTWPSLSSLPSTPSTFISPSGLNS